MKMVAIVVITLVKATSTTTTTTTAAKTKCSKARLKAVTDILLENPVLNWNERHDVRGHRVQVKAHNDVIELRHYRD